MVGWKHVALLLAAALLHPCTRAEAQCYRFGLDAAAPREVDTPKANHLSYFYDLEIDRYVITVTRGHLDLTRGDDGVPRGPFVLTRACLPAMLEWESERVVVLTYGCGTFCWIALALPVGPRGEPFSAMRPLGFDAERNLLAYYPDPGGLINVKNVVTGREQAVRTPDRCPTSSDTCFERLELENGRLRYVWKFWQQLPDGRFKYFPDEQIEVELDADVTGGP